MGANFIDFGRAERLNDRENDVMKAPSFRVFPLGLACLVAGCVAATVCAETVTLRIVTYNIEDDINGATTPLPGLINRSAGGSVTNGGVLKGIGEERRCYGAFQGGMSGHQRRRLSAAQHRAQTDTLKRAVYFGVAENM